MLIHPAPGFITGDKYGPRGKVPGVPEAAPFHGGQDFYPAKNGPRKIVAAADGVVVHHPYNKTAGNALCILHMSLGLWTGYAHNSRTHVAVGSRVVAGQYIADVGSTGASNGDHLHFDVFTDIAKFIRVNPLPLITSYANVVKKIIKEDTVDDVVIIKAGSGIDFVSVLRLGNVYSIMRGPAGPKGGVSEEEANLVKAGTKVVWIDRGTMQGILDGWAKAK